MRAFSLDREKVLARLREVSAEALAAFPQIREIRLFGSLAKGEQTGLSDVDVFVVTESTERNPVERMRPYFSFFTDRMGIAVDLIAAAPGEVGHHAELLKESILLARH